MLLILFSYNMSNLESKQFNDSTNNEHIDKFPEEPVVDNSRRGFLKKLAILGTAVALGPVISKAEGVISKEKNMTPEAFIADQVQKIKDIISNKRYEKVKDNAYLASLLYYSQRFLSETTDPSRQHFIPEKIMAEVKSLITPDFRAAYLGYLEQVTKDKERLKNKKISSKEKVPLQKFSFGKGENHKDAVDLFTHEQAPIYAIGGGIVMVADRGWKPNDETSSSSMRGGNTVIIFNYQTKEFYRYAHLKEVAVEPGELVLEGEILGTVGHTGKNATLKGHGQHLHFEINKYLSFSHSNKSLTADELKVRLQRLQDTA